MIRRNVVANYLGRGWSGLLGLAFIPLYIQYLGIEAYGLIGLFALIQSWLTLLDMGLTPTLNREMARFTAGAHDVASIRTLLRSIEIVCFSLAAVVAACIWLASGWLAEEWLNPGDLSTAIVADALSVMAVVVALRFCEGIYRGALYGLQQQVWYNGALAGLSALRHGGAVVVVALITPSVWAFFLWQGMVSLLTVAVYAAKVHRLIPALSAPTRFSSSALARVSQFAGGMMAITALTVALTTVDKVLLSKLLQLEHFGYYTLAASVAAALYMLTAPVVEAIYPRMVELVTLDDYGGLVRLYHQGAQFVTVLTAPAAFVISFFSAGVIFAWSGDFELASNTAPILSALVLGTFLNGLMWMPYRCQLAHAWTRLGVGANAMAVLIFIPAVFITVRQFGAIGAAWTWVALNAAYVLFIVHYMHRRLLVAEKWRWYGGDIALPAAGAIGVVVVAQLMEPGPSATRMTWGLFLIVTGSLSALAAMGLATDLRRGTRIIRGVFGGRRQDARLRAVDSH